MGQPPDSFYGSINVPIHMSSTFIMNDCDSPYFRYFYSRLGNPTRESLETWIASLESGKYGLATSSGLSAIMLITHLLTSGDHMLICDDVYGGTYTYFSKIATKKYGMEVSFIDMTDLDLLKSSIKDNTKMVLIETPTNPLLKWIDIKAVSEIWQERGLIFVVDNTFMSPYNQRPLELGADIVLHSATKYLGGHADVIMGAIVTNNKDFYDELYFLLYSIGSIPSPFDCYLVLRSLKTLSIRMKQIGDNGLQVAKYLQSHPMVEKVYYPFLETHKYYEVHKKQAKSGAGVISFVIKDGTAETSSAFLKSLKLISLAVSLGGVESLAECPALITHAKVPKEQREKIGIVDGLIRLSVGIEDVDDITSDIEQALDSLRSKSRE